MATALGSQGGFGSSSSLALCPSQDPLANGKEKKWKWGRGGSLSPSRGPPEPLPTLFKVSLVASKASQLSGARQGEHCILYLLLNILSILALILFKYIVILASSPWTQQQLWKNLVTNARWWWNIDSRSCYGSSMALHGAALLFPNFLSALDTSRLTFCPVNVSPGLAAGSQTRRGFWAGICLLWKWPIPTKNGSLLEILSLAKLKF